MNSVGVALSEGFCSAGHELTPAYLHGEPYACCFTCGASWRFDDNGKLWGVACVPGDHTCSKGDAP